MDLELGRFKLGMLKEGGKSDVSEKEPSFCGEFYSLNSVCYFVLLNVILKCY